MSYLLDIPRSRYLFYIYIYLLYPTPTFCLQKWVEPGGWCRKSGLLLLVSVCLVSSVISWMPKPAAEHVRDLPMCVLAALPVTQIVGKALVRHIWLSVSSGGSKQVQLSGPQERAVHAMKSLCEQVGSLYAHIKTFIHLIARPPGLSRGQAIHN